jgi:ABC-type Fe3+/spermidine/putrescine transport system ATPase subunit
MTTEEPGSGVAAATGPAGHVAAAAPVALSVADVHVSYGGFAALKGVSLEVKRGEFVALLGPSGCGKTSLLRTIAGFVQPQSGAVRLNGRDVAGLPPRLRNIGLVFQSYALFPHMTVLQNVLFGLECHKVPRQEATTRARAALNLVSLGALSDRRPKQLSGGQQQRVALARAVVIQPDLLLLDEPLGALDKQLRVQMQTELKSLQRRLGVTAVFVTHDQEEAMSMADRIVVLRDGVIVQVDTPETLFGAPSSSWVCEFVGAGNLLRGPLVRAGDNLMRLELAPGSCIDVAGTPAAGGAVQVPFDKLRIQAGGDAGLLVIGQRFLGSLLELQIESSAGTICAHVPPADGVRFPVGSRVVVGAAAAHCRSLPDL